MAGHDWLLLPVLGSAALCCLLVPLGYQVIRRGVIFADLAIAQWAALGSLAGQRLPVDGALAGMPISSLLTALLAALVVQGILRFCRQAREALIGILYVLGANLAILLVSGDPHGAQALHRAVSGDLLWATGDLVSAVAGLALVSWVLSGWRPNWMSGAWFLPVFAVSVTFAVTLAGVYVVFATLIITPLLQGTLLRSPVWVATACAVVGHWLAIGLSAFTNLPTGPAVVVILFAVSAAVWLTFRLIHLQRSNLRLH